MEKTLKENFSVFGRTTLRKFGKMKIYIEGLSRVIPLSLRLEQISPLTWSSSLLRSSPFMIPI